MESDMKIAVYSLTRDRIEYTRRSFASLQEKAGVPYDHFVFDNGSEDGNPEWLQGWLTEECRNTRVVIFGEKNYGIAIAANRLLDAIRKRGTSYDLVIKMDSDCEVITPNILGQITEVFGAMQDHGPTWILSPRVEGIVNQPRRVRANRIAGRRIGITGMVGGLFLCAPASVYEEFRFPEDLPKARGCDSALCHWLRQRGGETGYVEGLVVNHMDTTDGQAKKYPEYFARKRIEEKEIP